MLGMERPEAYFQTIHMRFIVLFENSASLQWGCEGFVAALVVCLCSCLRIWTQLKPFHFAGGDSERLVAFLWACELMIKPAILCLSLRSSVNVTTVLEGLDVHPWGPAAWVWTLSL